jgi:hypothetical protein
MTKAQTSGSARVAAAPVPGADQVSARPGRGSAGRAARRSSHLGGGGLSFN